jgi:hypothetical protein
MTIEHESPEDERKLRVVAMRESVTMAEIKARMIQPGKPVLNTAGMAVNADSDEYVFRRAERIYRWMRDGTWTP